MSGRASAATEPAGTRAKTRQIAAMFLNSKSSAIVTTPRSRRRLSFELIEAGEDQQRVIEILSKIGEGLTQSPEQLVENAPITIVQGVQASDAKRVQLLMEKIGAKVRLIKS